jgi:hypothetical protein
LGAGTSKACGLPDVAELQALITAGLSAEQKAAFETQLAGRNLEQALSRTRRIAALLGDGPGKVDGLDGKAAASLDGEVCRLIVEKLNAASADLEPVVRFAAWAARSDYSLPLEVFTVNYDLLIETGLERLGAPYFDGFIGSLRAGFRTELVEATPSDASDWLPAFLVRLWKLHGSVSWEWETGDRAEVVRLGAPVASGKPAAIYPSDTKYDESRRVPFVVLQDRFRRALEVPETLVIITGYSWGDAHLNEMLFDAARRRPRSEFVSFSRSALPDVLAARAEALPNIQALASEEAVLGGLRAEWDGPSAELKDVWEGGKCVLGDFRHMAAYFARSSPLHGEMEQRVADVIAALTTAGA